MQDKRQYKRYHLDAIEINGKMSLTNKVHILDISLGGVALKTDRRLNIGREYVIKLQEKGTALEVKGTVIRSELTGIEQSADGQGISIFTVGMVFKEGTAEKLADFLKPIEQKKKKRAAPSVAERRLNVRFNITTPQEKILSYPLQFRVKEISLDGMLIQTEQALEINKNIPMEFSLNADNMVTFIGQVVSCDMTEHTGQTIYDIGVEFTDLADKNTVSIKTFVDYLSGMEEKSKG